MANIDVKKLFDTISLLNGIDKYVPSDVPDTPLSGDRMMIIPKFLDRKCFVLGDNDVGMQSLLNPNELFFVAAENYLSLVAAKHPHPIIVAILRAFLLSRGFLGRLATDPNLIVANFARRAEIKVVKPTTKITLDDKFEIVDIDRELIPLHEYFMSDIMEDIPILVSLLPVFAAIQFQKTNHHYIDNADYSDAYFKHFKSAMQEPLAQKYNKVSIIYDAVHWLGPYNMECFKENLLKSPSGLLPRGIMLKAHSAPAGSALILTQRAVWNAIGAFPGTEELIRSYTPQLTLVNEMAETIMQNRLAYHVFSKLFNVPSELESKAFKDAILCASQLAAIGQAFLDSIAVGSDLAKAKALRKHSEQNLGLYNIAKSAFDGAMIKARKEARTKSISQALVPRITQEKAPPKEPEIEQIV